VDKKELKFIFAPIGVACGLTVFIFISITLSKVLHIQDLSNAFPFIPGFVFVSVGVLLLVIFFPVFIAGIYYLNRRGAVGQSNTLRTNGIYRYARNPMYIGISMIIIGIGLIMLHSGVIIGGLLWFCITFIQCKREEKELLNRFDKEYEVYKSRTPMFIPNIGMFISDVLRRSR
jgi:protein-S-isoprenylcysteine O-methyltransferase Ste14